MIPKRPAPDLIGVGTGFRKRSCSKNRMERDDDSRKSQPAPKAFRSNRSGIVMAASLSIPNAIDAAEADSRAAQYDRRRVDAVVGCGFELDKVTWTTFA